MRISAPPSAVAELYTVLFAALILSGPVVFALEPSPDELAVYRVVFSDEELVVLRDTGTTAEGHTVYPDWVVAGLHKRFPTAEDSTIASFLSHQVPALLKPKSEIGVPIVMLDSETYKKLYGRNLAPLVQQSQRARDNAWSAFLWHYRKARAVTWITRVGFNSNSTQALLFMQQTTGPKVGDEQRGNILLDLRNGIWTVTKKEKDQ